jgi:hypothetical protein
MHRVKSYVAIENDAIDSTLKNKNQYKINLALVEPHRFV